MTTTPTRSHASGAPRGRAPSSAPAEILAATEAILLEEGSAGLSIRKVSERSGYTAPTIYHHFGDKTGLVDAVLEPRFREIYELMAEIPGGDDPAKDLREIAAAFIGFAFEHPDHYRLLTTPRPEAAAPVPSADAAQELVKRRLEELAAVGDLATPDVEAAYQVTSAVIQGVISFHLNRPADEPLAAGFLELALDTVERGMLRLRPHELGTRGETR
ncbi:MAG: TetR/AcrR family transcriptional regulator [Myxococcota bacterium]